MTWHQTIGKKISKWTNIDCRLSHKVHIVCMRMENQSFIISLVINVIDVFSSKFHSSESMTIVRPRLISINIGKKVTNNFQVFFKNIPYFYIINQYQIL